MLNREQKTKIIDYLEKLCEGSRISKKTLGNTIRSYHVSLPFVVIIFLFYSSQALVSIVACQLISVFFLFFITNGCLLTMLEHRLCGDEFTISDPFIEVLGIELNSKNRVNVSYFIATGFFIFYFLVYYYRFYYKKYMPKANILPKAASVIPMAASVMPMAASVMPLADMLIKSTNNILS
jgi:hypothetical protein